MSETQSSYQGYLTLLGGILVTLVQSNMFLWGNITEYVQSYFYHMGDLSATP
jgi:hypothetical protein